MEVHGKRSKAKTIMENNPESDRERTAGRSSHMLVQAAAQAIPVLHWQSSAVSATSITYRLTCAEPWEESALYSPEQLRRASKLTACYSKVWAAVSFPKNSINRPPHQRHGKGTLWRYSIHGDSSQVRGESFGQQQPVAQPFVLCAKMARVL